jgi:2-amino-4-hydroxy-6-hydroxymethyldihydropteridine diphosphokinase
VQNSHVSFLSLGTNLGDKSANLRRALALLFEAWEVVVVNVSSIYETAAQNITEKDDFLNYVCKIETALSSIQFLNFCKSAEAKLGRRAAPRYGPRTIKIDILLCDDLNLATAELSLPHPELIRRNVALTPLHEITPDLVIQEKPIAHWLSLCRDQRVAFYAAKLA